MREDTNSLISQQIAKRRFKQVRSFLLAAFSTSFFAYSIPELGEIKLLDYVALIMIIVGASLCSLPWIVLITQDQLNDKIDYALYKDLSIAANKKSSKSETDVFLAYRSTSYAYRKLIIGDTASILAIILSLFQMVYGLLILAGGLSGGGSSSW